MKSTVVLALAVLAGCSSGNVTRGSTSSGGSGPGSGGAGSTSSGGTGSGGSSGGATFYDFCEHYPSAVCSTYQACGMLDPAANCTTPTTTDCDAGGFYSYSVTQGEACLALLAGATSQCSSTEVFGVEPDGGTPCALAVQPGVAWGGACETAAGQCIPPADGGLVYCLAAPGTCGGTCGRGAPNGYSCALGGCAEGFCNGATELCAPYLPLGAECTLETNGCDPRSAYCIFPPDAGYSHDYCTPLVSSGSLCFLGGCVAGDSCVSPDGGYLTSCQVQLAVGSPCSASAAGWCQSGSICFEGSCVATPASLGSACGLVGGAFQACSQGYCNNPDGGAGTCVAPGGMGAPCVAPLDCQSGLTCVSGACASFAVAVGSACTSSQVCTNGYCNNGTCAADATAGQACTSDVQCAFPTLCVGGACANPPSAGHPCASAGSALFPQGCAYGDYCASGTCTKLGATGDACQNVRGGNTCAAGRCDATGHCAAFLSPGSICAPTEFECSQSVFELPLADGGESPRDAACLLPSDGGATICVVACE